MLIYNHSNVLALALISVHVRAFPTDVADATCVMISDRRSWWCSKH